MKKPEVPFFARYLESQETLEVRTDVKAGKRPPPFDPPAETMKYPSDNDDDPPVVEL